MVTKNMDMKADKSQNMVNTVHCSLARRHRLHDSAGGTVSRCWRSPNCLGPGEGGGAYSNAAQVRGAHMSRSTPPASCAAIKENSL